MLSCKDLQYFYDERKCDGINNISFQLVAGDICALVGPSGSGKSTFLKVLANILVPKKGYIDSPSVEFFDFNFMAQDQFKNFGQLKVWEYLENNNSDLKTSIRDLVSNLDLTNEYESRIEQLSSGQFLRVLLIKAFLSEKKLILLDEPFLFLDPHVRLSVAKFLIDLTKTQSKMLIWSTHFLEEALCLSTKIMVMQFGELQQISAPEAIYWEPANIFVANYFFPCNLLAATINPDKKSVSTKWGTFYIDHLKLESFSKLSQVFLMIRPQSLLPNMNNIYTKNLIKFKIKTRLFQGQFYRYYLERDGREWIMDVAFHEQANNILNNENEIELHLPESQIKIIQ